MNFFSYPIVSLHIAYFHKKKISKVKLIPHNPATSDIILHIRSNFNFEVSKTLGHKLFAQPHNFLLWVSQPSRRSGVGRQTFVMKFSNLFKRKIEKWLLAFGSEIFLTDLFLTNRFPQKSQSFLFCHAVLNVSGDKSYNAVQCHWCFCHKDKRSAMP